MNDELSLEQQATNAKTLEHIICVQKHLQTIVKELLDRGLNHDKSKLDHPEVEGFTQETPILATLTYNSPEYKESLARLKPALDHHYAKNRHHPEHFPNGLRDMTLIDIVELFADWAASAERQHNGNLQQSIDSASIRFHMSDDLKWIFKNTTNSLKL